MQLWGRANSSNVMKVVWLLEELRLPYERIDAGGAFGRTREPAYLAMNPHAKVPTLVDDDGTVVWESNAILRYVVNRHAPGHALYPAAPGARADVERWMDWQLAALTAPVTQIFFTYVRIPEPQRDWDATARAVAEAGGLLTVLDARLRDGAYLCGDALTLADIAIGPYLHRWFALPIERPELPALARWRDRLLTHAGYRRHIADVPMT